MAAWLAGPDRAAEAGRGPASIFLRSLVRKARDVSYLSVDSMVRAHIPTGGNDEPQVRTARFDDRRVLLDKSRMGSEQRHRPRKPDAPGGRSEPAGERQCAARRR